MTWRKTDEFEDGPDRSMSYRDTDPAKLRDQLNENWRQLRLFKAAIQDRDRVIAELHEAIHRRDALIVSLNKRTKLINRVRPLAYAALGGIATKLSEWALILLLTGRIPH